MGGCEGCSINQCHEADSKDCVVVEGKSGEDTCVTNTCTNTNDCRKLFVNEPWRAEKSECKNGTCVDGILI